MRRRLPRPGWARRRAGRTPPWFPRRPVRSRSRLLQPELPGRCGSHEAILRAPRALRQDRRGRARTAVAGAVTLVRSVSKFAEAGTAGRRSGRCRPGPGTHYRGRMPSRPERPQLGLFDNPVRVFSLDELVETVRKLERERPGRTTGELSRAVFAELAMKRTRRAAELVDEAIRVARTREPRAEITGSRWQASTSEVRNWALGAGFELGSNGVIPEQAITAYNQIHPERPY